MSVEFDGNTYKVAESLRLPNPGSDIRTFDLLTTDDDYGLMMDGTSFAVFRMSDRSMVYSEAFPFTSLYHAGIIELGGLLGALYSDGSSDQAIFVHASSDDFIIRYYPGLYQGRAVVGAFTRAGANQVVYDDGYIFEYDEERDEFFAVDHFGTDISSGFMVTADLDGDGLNEIISSWSGGVACFSGLDLGLVWETDIYLGMVCKYISKTQNIYIIFFVLCLHRMLYQLVTLIVMAILMCCMGMINGVRCMP